MSKYKRYSTKALNNIFQENKFGLLFEQLSSGVRFFDGNLLEPSTTVCVRFNYKEKSYNLWFTYYSQKCIAHSWLKTRYGVSDFGIDRQDRTLNGMVFSNDQEAINTYHKVKFSCYILLTKYFRMIDENINILLVGDFGPHFDQESYIKRVNEFLNLEEKQ